MRSARPSVGASATRPGGCATTRKPSRGSVTNDKQERGAVLVMTLGLALVSVLAVYTMLFLATAQAGQTRFYRQRLQVGYASAEAALVWAQARLQADPSYCGTPDPPPINGVTVDVQVFNVGSTTVCTPGVGQKRLVAHIQR